MDATVFEVSQESDGCFVAERLTEGIFTQADTWQELPRHVAEAVRAYYLDSQPPPVVRLYSLSHHKGTIREEILSSL